MLPFVGLSACTSPGNVSPGEPLSTATFTDGLPIIDKLDQSMHAIPWHLSRIDSQQNRVYLSTGKSGCSYPIGATVEKTSKSITITVAGKSASGPCTSEEYISLTYVQLNEPIENREILGAGN